MCLHNFAFNFGNLTSNEVNAAQTAVYVLLRERVYKFWTKPPSYGICDMFIVIIAGSIIGGIPAIIKAGGSIIMHEASHTHDKLAATSDFYEPNLTLFHGF